jgi:hypothetical protein
MKALNKILQEVQEEVRENSFDNTIYHKIYTYYTYDIIVIFKGSKNDNQIECYNIMVIDLMTGKVSTKYSRTVFCLKNFFGKKVSFYGENYDMDSMPTYYHGEDVIKKMKRKGKDGLSVTKHVVDSESEKDVIYNKVIVRNGNQAFAVVLTSPVISTSERTTESIPTAKFIIYDNEQCFLINRTNVFKMLKDCENEEIIKLKKKILLLFKNMNKLTEENKKDLKIFLGKESERIFTPIYKHKNVTIQLYTVLGMNYHYNMVHNDNIWYNDDTRHCYTIVLKNNTSENRLIASRILEDIIHKNLPLHEYMSKESNFLTMKMEDDYVFVNCSDANDMAVFINTELGMVRITKEYRGYSEDDFDVLKRSKELREKVDKRLTAMAKLSGKSKNGVVIAMKNGD